MCFIPLDVCLLVLGNKNIWRKVFFLLDMTTFKGLFQPKPWPMMLYKLYKAIKFITCHGQNRTLSRSPPGGVLQHQPLIGTETSDSNLSLFSSLFQKQQHIIMSSYSLCNRRVLVEIKMDVKIIPFEPHRESMSNTIHSTAARGKILTSHLHIMKC